MSDAFTYVVEARNGLVKIGCSRKPAERLQQIRLYSPVLARLVAMWPAERGEELDLHKRFDAYRSHKEWFAVEGAVVAFLSEVWGRGVVEIPAWESLTFHDDDGSNRLFVLRSEQAKARWSDPAWAARWHASRARHSASNASASGVSA